MLTKTTKRYIFISISEQKLFCYENDNIHKTYSISSAKNGVGELYGSECTPRGWHRVYARFGFDTPINAVFKAREWTKEIFTEELAKENPGRDWIITRIIQIEGLEPGRNHGGEVDSLNRKIYIHGTPDSVDLSKRGSRGCIRLYNKDVIELADWAKIDTMVCIE